MARSNILGRVPTSYLGNTAVTPPNFHEYDRVPNQNDSKNFIIGDLWLYWDQSFTPRKPRLFFLASLAGTAQKTLIADWREFDFSTGGNDLETITGDISTGFGSAQPVSGDPNDNYNLDMIGATDLQFDGDPATYSFQVTNKVKLTPYVVGEDAYQYRFTSIQAAIDQAVLDGANSSNQPAVIFITPGIYNEDIALADGVILIGHQSISSVTTSTAIIGTLSIPAAGTYGLFSLSFNKLVNGNLLTVTGTDSISLNIQNCRFLTQTPADDCISNDNPNFGLSVRQTFFQSNANCLNLTTGNTIVNECQFVGNIVGTNLNLFQFSGSGITGDVTFNGTNVQILTIKNNTFNESLVTVNGAAVNFYISDCFWQNTTDKVALSVNDTSIVNLNNCTVLCNSSGGEWAIGNGTIRLNTISLLGSAYTMNSSLGREGGVTLANSIDLNTTASNTAGQGQIKVIGNRYFHTAGTQSTYAGYQAGNLTNTGSNNDVFGGAAGTSLTTGNRNLFLGREAGNSYTTETDNVAIYSPGIAGSSHQMWIGGVYGTGAYQTTDTFITGRVRRPYTNAFDAYNNASIPNVIGNGVSYTAIFNTEDLDQRGDYDTATGIFTCSKEGLYYFDGKISLLNIGASNTDVDIFFSFTGSVSSGTSRLISAGNLSASLKTTGNAFRISGSVLEYLEVGDTCRIIINVTGGTQTISLGGSQFGGWLVA
jgi:hypothetical protein